MRTTQTIHAEHNCINKLPKNDGRIKNVSILIIRTNKLGELISSKPCMHCIYKMNEAVKMGYRITNVYYSDKNGEIVKTSLSKLNQEDNKHVCGYFKRHNF
jgi:cytidine deaminase